MTERVVDEVPFGRDLNCLQEVVPLVGGSHRMVGVEVCHVQPVAVFRKSFGKDLDGGHYQSGIV